MPMNHPPSFNPLRFVDPVNPVKARTAMVAEVAYFLAQRRGFAPGHDLEDWRAAEIEVDRRLARKPP